MKRPSDMPIVCSIIEIDPGPERICNIKGDDRMVVKAALDRYLESPHQQVQSLHSSITDETKWPYLREPPWKEVLWIGTTEGVPFRNQWQLFFISGQDYHTPFMEWAMKKLFKMSGPDPVGDEYMEKGVPVYIKHPD